MTDKTASKLLKSRKAREKPATATDSKSAILTKNQVVFASLPSEDAIEIWAGITSRSDEHVEIDGLGVMLWRDGKRYSLHQWGELNPLARDIV